METTVHAGEWSGADSVRQALTEMGASRIGHGVRVMEDSEVANDIVGLLVQAKYHHLQEYGKEK